MRTDYGASNYTSKMTLQQTIKSANRIWLSTHIRADGDGLGSEIALFYALRNLNLNAELIHNDPIPPRYTFLVQDLIIHDIKSFDTDNFCENDLVIIFDTHDPKLCQPFIDFIVQKKIKIVFIDHHVVFKQNLENAIYHIDESASCTGEIVLDLIKSLNCKLDKNIATAIYTSLLFDTQSFKAIRDSTKPFDIAKELIAAGANHKYIHQQLFCTWSLSKMKYLSKLITEVIYTNDQFAIIPIQMNDLETFELSTDDVSDLIDLFMSIKNLQTSVVLREEGENYFKLSFRSRTHEVLSWARAFGGGGHLFSSGAWVHDTRSNIMKVLENLIHQN